MDQRLVSFTPVIRIKWLELPPSLHFLFCYKQGDPQDVVKLKIQHQFIFNWSDLIVGSCICRFSKWYLYLTFYVKKLEMVLQQSILQSTIGSLAVCIHTCFSRSLGSHFIIKQVFITPCLYSKNNLPLCLWDLPISLKENKFLRNRQNSKLLSYGLSRSNKPMNEVGKQP